MKIVDIFNKIKIHGAIFLRGLFYVFGTTETIGPPSCSFCTIRVSENLAVGTVNGTNAEGKRISLPACTYHLEEAASAISWTVRHLRKVHLLEKWDIKELYQ